jgi:hypothetical protein
MKKEKKIKVWKFASDKIKLSELLHLPLSIEVTFDELNMIKMLEVESGIPLFIKSENPESPLESVSSIIQRSVSKSMDVRLMHSALMMDRAIEQDIEDMNNGRTRTCNGIYALLTPSPTIDPRFGEESEGKKTIDFNPKEFEIGKWYRAVDIKTGNEYLFKKTSEGQGHGFFKGEWTLRWQISTPFNFCIGFDCIIREANHEEVFEALKREAPKQGFKEGTKFISLAFGDKHTAKSSNFEYALNRDTLYLDGYAIYKNGEWAEIIKDEVMTVNGVDIEFKKTQLGTPVKFTMIKGRSFSKEFWESAKKIIATPGASIVIDAAPEMKLTPPIVYDILQRLK